MALLPNTHAEQPIQHLDKLKHMAAFCVLMFTFQGSRFQVNKAYSLLFILMIGCMIEILQSFTPTREFSLYDIVADGIGSILGLWLYQRYHLSRVLNSQ